MVIRDGASAFLNIRLAGAWRRFGPIVEAEFRRQMLAGRPPRVVRTLDPEFSRLRGAAALVFKAAL
jgi:hypothetical protein